MSSGGSMSDARRSRKYIRFEADLQKQLQALDRTPQFDWSSMYAELSLLQQCIESYKDVDEFPARWMACSVLNKCLDMQCAMGVHRKAIDVLARLCARLQLSDRSICAPLYTAGVFQLLPAASSQVKSDLMTFVEMYVVTLPAPSLSLLLPGLLAAVLGGLEEAESSEMHGRVVRMLESIRHTVEAAAPSPSPAPGAHPTASAPPPKQSETLASNGVRTRHVPLVGSMFTSLWSVVRNVPAVRYPAMMYLRSILTVAPPSLGHRPDTCTASSSPTAGARDRQGPLTAPTCLEPIMYCADHPHLVFEALMVALKDKNERCQRAALDLVVFHFPLHEVGALPETEKVLIVAAMLRLLALDPSSTSISRRVLSYLCGHQAQVHPSQYVQYVSARYVTSALRGALVHSSAMHSDSEWCRGKAGARSLAPALTAQEVMHFEALSPPTAESEADGSDAGSRLSRPLMWLDAITVLLQRSSAPSSAQDATPRATTVHSAWEGSAASAPGLRVDSSAEQQVVPPSELELAKEGLAGRQKVGDVEATQCSDPKSGSSRESMAPSSSHSGGPKKNFGRDEDAESTSGDSVTLSGEPEENGETVAGPAVGPNEAAVPLPPVAGNGDAGCTALGAMCPSVVCGLSPFLHCVAPLTLPFICEPLVRIGQRKSDRATTQALATERILTFLEVIPWEEFLNYTHVTLLAARQQLGDGLWPSGDAARGGSGALADKVAENVARNMVLNSLTQAHGIAEVTSAHYFTMQITPERHQSCLDLCCTICKLLCSIIELVSQALNRSAERCDSSSGPRLCHAWLATSEIIRRSVETFHLYYFGAATLLLEAAFMANKREVYGDLLAAFASAYSSVLEASIIASGARTGGPVLMHTHREDGALFGTVTDTLFSMLLQCGDGFAITASLLGDRETAPLSRNLVWLRRTAEATAYLIPDSAVFAAQLYISIISTVTLDEVVLEKLEEWGSTRFVLQNIWELVESEDSSLRVHVANVLIQASETPTCHALLEEILDTMAPDNCRRLMALLATAAELELGEQHFFAGLNTMIRSLGAPEVRVRQMGLAFLSQSLPYLQRVLNPFLMRLKNLSHRSVADEAPGETCNAGADAAQEEPLCLRSVCNELLQSKDLRNFICALKSMLDTPLRRAVVQRLWSTPEPPFADEPIRSLRLPGAATSSGPTEMPIKSMFALVCFILFHVVRIGHCPLATAEHLEKTHLNSNRLHLEHVLRTGSDSDATPGEENLLCVYALELLNVLLRESMDDNPQPCESVVHTWHFISVMVLSLLSTAISARLPSMQINLLETLVGTVSFLDDLQPPVSSLAFVRYTRRSCSAAVGAQGDSNSRGGNPVDVAAVSGDGASDVAQASAEASRKSSATVLTTPLFHQVMENGYKAAAAAELQPRMSCYGLLNAWKTTIVKLLPYCRDDSNLATCRVLTSLTQVQRLFLERAYTPAVAWALSIGFDGLTQVVMFLVGESKGRGGRGGSATTAGLPIGLAADAKVSGSAASSVLHVGASASGATHTESASSAAGLPRNRSLDPVSWFVSQAQNLVLPSAESNPPLTPPADPLRQALENLGIISASAFIFGRQGREPRVPVDQLEAMARQALDSSIIPLVHVLLRDFGLDFFEIILGIWCSSCAVNLPQQRADGKREASHTTAADKPPLEKERVHAPLTRPARPDLPSTSRYLNRTGLQRSHANAGATVAISSRAPSRSSVVQTMSMDGSDGGIVMEFIISCMHITPVGALRMVAVLLHRSRRSKGGPLAQLINVGRGVVGGPHTGYGAPAPAPLRNKTPIAVRGRHTVVGQLPVDAGLLHFLVVFVKAYSGAEKLDSFIRPALDILLTYLSSGAHSIESVAFVFQFLGALHSKAMAGTGTSGRGPSAPSSDPHLLQHKHLTPIVCKAIEAYANAAVLPKEGCGADHNLASTMHVLCEVLPRLVADTAAHVDRIADVCYMLFCKVLLPRIRLAAGEKSVASDRDTIWGDAITALVTVKALAKMADPVSRRLRSDVLDALVSQPLFFTTPSSVLRSWRGVLRTLSKDRAFHMAALQQIYPSSTTSSKIVSIVLSRETESLHRSKVMKQLAFYVLSAASTAFDRETVVFLHEKILDVLRQYPIPPSSVYGDPVAPSKKKVHIRPLRYALLLFRVLMLKVTSAALQSLWASVVPLLIAALELTSTTTLDADDLRALQVECIKVIDFAIVLVPSEFQMFRWIFLDDGRTIGSGADHKSVETAAPITSTRFVPLLRRMVDEAAPSPSVDLMLVNRGGPYPSAASQTLSDTQQERAPAWSARHRPLLSLSDNHYESLRGVAVLGHAISQISNCTSASHVFAHSGPRAPEAADVMECFVRHSDLPDVEYIFYNLDDEFSALAGRGGASQ